jgi:hypothetical protein
MTQTAVATVWEPQLSSRSLPGGLPWSSEDETPISSAAAQILVSSGPNGVFLSEPWIAQPLVGLTGRLQVAAATSQGLRLVRFERVTEGIMVALVEFTRDDTNLTHGLIARLKERLDIAWEPLLEVLDYPYRTFFTHRKAGILPNIPGLAAAVRVLASMADEDPIAARALLSGRSEEIRSLLRETNLSAVQGLFRRTRRELSQQGRVLIDPALIVAEHLDEFRTITASPEFTVAAQAIEGFTQQSGMHAAARMVATVELETALVDARTGDDLTPEWDFLPILTFAEMDALRARAHQFIGSDGFTVEAWREFVAAEAARASDAYSPLVLPADPVEPAAAQPAGRRRYGGPSFTERLSR